MVTGTLSILIVGDDKDDFVMVRDLLAELRDASYHLSWVSSFEQGMAALKRGEHDIYLVDNRLGARSGLEFLKEAIEAGCSSPVILLTGYGDHEIDLQAMNSGAADYLVKTQLSAPLLERSIRYSVFHSHSIETLKDREKNFRDLFNSTFEGIIIHRFSPIIDVNEAAAQIFGCRRGEMLGKRVTDFAAPEYRQRMVEAIHSGTLVNYEIVGLRGDGSEVPLEVAAKPYTFRGEAVRLTSVRDVSARKQMEAQILQQDRLASIGLLASSLAHEIGTPLGVIRGRAEFLQMQLKGNEVIRANAEVISSQIDRVSKLIRSLLNLARGDRKGTATTIFLDQVVSDVVLLMAHEVRRHGIEIENAVPTEARIVARAEAEPLQQVVLNLLVNSVHAIEAAIRGGRAVSHRIRIFLEEQDSQWALCVQDTGTGITPENLKNLFKPFFTTKDIGQGTGLGLATSYRIVEAWGGTMQVQSQFGVGTTFKVLLPKG